MSGRGAPRLPVDARAGAGLRVAVVAALWHDRVATGLLDGAVRVLVASGASHHVVRVPGAFELPLVAQASAADSDAVVALGAADSAQRDRSPAHDPSDHALRRRVDDLAGCIEREGLVLRLDDLVDPRRRARA